MYKIVVFGTGLYYTNRQHLLKDTEVIGYLDNDAAKCGKSMNNKKIVYPENIRGMNYDFIILMSKKENQTAMKKQLVKLGVEAERILSFEEYNDRVMESNHLGRSSLLSNITAKIEIETMQCKKGQDIFKCYDQLKQMINDAEGLTEDESKQLKNICKGYWLKNIDGILLDFFWK